MPDEKIGWLTRLGIRLARRQFGQVPEPLRVMLHHRGLMWANGIHELVFQRAAKVLDAELRELVIHRVATRIGCSWCVDFGTMMTIRAGFSVERHRELGHYRTSGVFTEREKLALAFADAMTDLPMTVDDELVAALRAELGDAGLLELTYSVAIENMRARTNLALGVTAQGYTRGDACPVPWADQIASASP